jgi:hypothetical protein
LEGFGLIEVERGERRVGVFSLSNRWQAIGADEAKRIVAAHPAEPSRSRPGRRLWPAAGQRARVVLVDIDEQVGTPEVA